MNDTLIEKKEHIETTQEKLVGVQIKFSSTKKEDVEKISTKLVGFLTANQIEFVKSTPPKKVGQIVTRKSPCGQGTCTFAKYKLKIFSSIYKYTTEHSNITRVAALLDGADSKVEISISG